MQAFEYANPKTLRDALSLLGQSWEDAGVLAGGTDLLSLMKDHVATPKRVVNIKNVKELDGLSKTSAGLRIGALTTFDELASNAQVRSEYPALVTAALGVASPQIRNMGTVGGDLCQRPRCWYFRMGYGLLAKDESGAALIPDGQNEYHAIFTRGPAHFVSASSLGPALAALGARVKIASASGEREVPAEEFFVAPQSDSDHENVLKPNEILTEIVVPSASGVRNATYEVRQKEALDWPLATASVALRMSGGAVSGARVFLGHVAPTPWPAKQAEQALVGKKIDEATAEEAGRLAVEGATPLSQNGYKVQLARTAVKRALLEAARGKA